MAINNRREFIKKTALVGASALIAPSLFATGRSRMDEPFLGLKENEQESKFIVPKNNGLKITGTFLDEISHDIPHQNWGGKRMGNRFSIYEENGD